MITLLALVQVLLSFALIVLVLMHSGKGGGISDMLGGAATVASGSTVVEKNLNRITMVLGILFAFNSVALGLIWTS
ncbi:MAG: preprotein translocase subunit SecG [Acidimicrobiales bacterium]